MTNLALLSRIAFIAVLSLLLSNCATQPAPAVTQVAPPDELSTPGSLSQAQQVEFRAAITEIGKENYKRGIKLLKQLDKQGDFDSVAANLALAYYKTSQLDDAKNSVNRALQINSSNAKAHNLSGLIAMQEGEFPKAEQAFLEALKLDNNYALAHYNLALLYDVYYQEIRKAYDHYLRYLVLVEYSDKETMSWVEQLKYSVEQENTQ